MKTERRALNSEEREVFAAAASWQVDWKELIFLSTLGGAGFGVLIWLILAGFFWLTGFEVANYLGVSNEGLQSILATSAALLSLVYVIWFEIREQKSAARRRRQVRERDDLIIERHQIADCKLVREPEHGQCMFFVRSVENKIIFVHEGHDKLDEDWKKNPLSVPVCERPKSGLKIIRLPENEETIMLNFFGAEIPVATCYEIGLDARFWPTSGKAIKPPWDNLNSRYRLKELAPEEN